MKHICPHCEKETNVEKIKTSEIFKVKDDEISVPVEYYKCNECGETFDDPMSSYDPVKMAFDEFC